jgi:hypothetical protein
MRGTCVGLCGFLLSFYSFSFRLDGQDLVNGGLASLELMSQYFFQLSEAVAANSVNAFVMECS